MGKKEKRDYDPNDPFKGLSNDEIAIFKGLIFRATQQLLGLSDPQTAEIFGEHSESIELYKQGRSGKNVRRRIDSRLLNAAERLNESGVIPGRRVKSFSKGLGLDSDNQGKSSKKNRKKK